MARQIPGASRSNLYHLPLDLLSFDPFLHRETPSDLEELKQSIRERGVLQPGVVWKRKDPSTGLEEYIVVAGASRLKALRELNEENEERSLTFPCQIVDAETRLEALQMALDENLRRNNLTGMDVCRYLWRLVEEEGFFISMDADAEVQRLLPDLPRLAAFFSRSEAWVSTHLAMRDLEKGIQKRVQSGEIPSSVAMKLTSLPQEEQQELLFSLEEKGEPITRDAVVKAKRERKGKGKEEGDEEDDSPTARTAKQIKDYFLEVLSTEDPKVISDPLAWKLSSTLVAHAKLMQKFISGALTDVQMDNALAKIIKPLLEDASKDALGRWKRKEA